MGPNTHTMEIKSMFSINISSYVSQVTAINKTPLLNNIYSYTSRFWSYIFLESQFNNAPENNSKIKTNIPFLLLKKKTPLLANGKIYTALQALWSQKAFVDLCLRLPVFFYESGFASLLQDLKHTHTHTHTNTNTNTNTNTQITFFLWFSVIDQPASSSYTWP